MPGENVGRFCFAQPTCQSTTLTFLQKCPITHTLHVHDLTFRQAGGGDGGTITGEEAGKPVTTGFYMYVS